MSQNLYLYRIRQRCTDETAKYRRGEPYDPSYCFKLFYQALHERDELAWNLLYEQYRPQVIVWVRRHPAYSSLDEDIDYFVNGALMRLWKNFMPKKFTKDTTVDSILKYLRMCVNSETQQYLRGKERRLITDSIDDNQKNDSTIPSTDLPLLGRMVEDEDRDNFATLIRSLLKDEQEVIVCYAFFELGLKPKTIYEQYGEYFSSVKEISRIRERIIKRLKGNSQVETFMSGI